VTGGAATPHLGERTIETSRFRDGRVEVWTPHVTCAQVMSVSDKPRLAGRQPFHPRWGAPGEDLADARPGGGKRGVAVATPFTERA